MRRSLVSILLGLALFGCGGSPARRSAVTPDEAAPVTVAPADHRTAVGDRVKRVERPIRIPVAGAKLTLVDYFATWCTSSARWMPHVEAMKQKYAAYGLAVVAVAHYAEEERAGAEAFVRTYGGTFPVVFDSEHVITTAIHPLTWGQSIIAIDADGVVRIAHVGTSEDAYAEVDAEIARLLGP